MMITAHSPKRTANNNIELLVSFPWLQEEVPFTASPTDCEEYGRFLYSRAELGDFGVVAPYVATVVTPIVPQKVSRFQALAALYQAGLLDDIKAYMADPATDGFTKLAWEEAQEFNRSSPMVATLGSLFGFTEVQMDNLFQFASSISA